MSRRRGRAGPRPHGGDSLAGQTRARAANMWRARVRASCIPPARRFARPRSRPHAWGRRPARPRRLLMS